MANKNPVQARIARRRRRKPGDLKQALLTIWNAINDVEHALNQAQTGEEICRAARAMSACILTYAKLLQTGELEARMAHLEMQLEALRLSQ
jgi:hypothetical protein